MKKEQTDVRVLIIYFSLSGQSRGLVNLFASGLKEEGVQVVVEQLRAQRKISFPFKNLLHTLWMMLTTFLRFRTPIKELHPRCFKPYDLIVLSGPTWSYNPSGPILSLLDRDGRKLFSGRQVLPLLSCRGFYRLHDFLLRLQLSRLGAELQKSLIFAHPVPEPWSTIGVLLKSSGYCPEKMKYLGTRFPHFGHTVNQLHQARICGRQTGLKLRAARRQNEFR